MLNNKSSDLKPTNTLEPKGLSILQENWAVAELGVTYKHRNRTGVTVNTAQDAYNVFMCMWEKELIPLQVQVAAIFLNKYDEVIGYRRIATGSYKSVTYDYRLIYGLGLTCNAHRFILAINRTISDVKATKAEIKSAKSSYKESLNIIPMRDKLYITTDSYYSFAESGKLF